MTSSYSARDAVASIAESLPPEAFVYRWMRVKRLRFESSGGAALQAYGITTLLPEETPCSRCAASGVDPTHDVVGPSSEASSMWCPARTTTAAASEVTDSIKGTEKRSRKGNSREAGAGVA